MDKKEINKEWYGIMLILWLSMRQDEYEWEKMKEQAYYSIPEIEKYFSKLFGNDYNVEEIQCGSHFFRARQVKNQDKNELGINKIYSKHLKSLQEECDKLNSMDEKITIDFSDFLLLKAFAEDEEREKIIKCIEPLLQNAQDEKFLGFNAEQSGPPPKGRTKAGRLNDVDDTFLYLAYDEATSVAEMRPIINQLYSVAECVTTKKLKIVNLFDVSSTIKANTLSKLYILSDKVSEPNTEPDSNSDRFYKITQILSHFLKEKGYDGIGYKSAMNKIGTNLVLFDPNNVEFIKSKLIRISNVKVEFEDEINSELFDN
ncbi:MAG: RES family NAD+ phosphorylase [Anaeroplasma sp.]